MKIAVASGKGGTGKTTVAASLIHVWPDPVAAMDLDAENVYGLRSGEVAVDAGGHWLAGGHALVLLHDLLQGREPLPGQERPFGLLTLTREELPAYENNYPQGLPAWDFSAVSRAHREGRPVVRDLRLHY